MREVRFSWDVVDTRIKKMPAGFPRGRLTGTLMTYERRAVDRPEIFESTALICPENGIVINEQHDRQQAIIRAIPYLKGDAVLYGCFRLPDTQRGRDAAISVRNGTLSGLSVEFRSMREGRRDGLRVIRSAKLLGAALVDTASYSDSYS